MKKIIFTLALIIGIQGAGIAIEDHDHEEFFKPVEIKNGSVLSIMDCVSTAFQNSPKVRRTKYNLDIAKSNVGMAKSQFFPTLGLGVGFYHENNSDNDNFLRRYHELPNVAVTLNQLIWDFGKSTSFIRMEKFYQIGAEYEFMDSLCETIFEVKKKYYDVLRTKAILEVSSNNTAINQNFVKIAKNRPDKLTAQIHLKEAQVGHIAAETNYDNALVDLNNAMYLEGYPKFLISDTSTFTYKNDFDYSKSQPTIWTFKPENFEFDKNKAVDIAYKNSPDLRVLIASKKAMEQNLLYIKRTYYPELAANVGYGFNNSSEFRNNSFLVGVNLTSTLNFMNLKHSIKGADAQVKLADNEVLLFKKDLYYEVRRALNNVERSEKQIPVAQNETQIAFENLKLVENQYKGGQLNYVALQDAREDFISAQVKYVDCLYDYNMALIQLEMAMHVHLVDIHHKSEHAMRYHAEELIEHLNKVLDCDQKEDKDEYDDITL